ncbi:MAG: sugar phosphorylase [Rubripirellula sp.]
MIDSTTAELIQEVYGEVPSELADGIAALEAQTSKTEDEIELWSERDVVLITYADQVRASGMSPLQAQRAFLLDHELQRLIRCVHLLPFCPFTSDDGFSVVDYLAVDPASGTWEDIADLGESFDLMFDLVLNHASQKHEWFQRYLQGDPDFADFFIDQDPNVDLSDVVRPRSLPLLTEFDSPSGTKHIWTTFSDDQVDLNYANPRVMLAMLETLVEYARRGARIIRLDAIAFLWKQVGTDCIHLPQTHAAVKLMRRVLDRAVPGTLVLTETNVPHKENVSYFGGGEDEAHMVYQFSLPPLLLDAIHNGDTSVLRSWLASLEAPSDSTTFFNFTASHDGIGVRPLEGIVPPERVQKLADVVRSHGGRVNTRRNSDGTDSPYELNITYLEAVADSSSVEASEHSRRFLATQAIMLSMRGMPAVYFHSLVGSPNDQEGVEQSGQNRRINRHKYDRAELEAALADSHGLQRRVFDGYQRLLEVRVQQPAFHPRAAQDVLPLPEDGLLGFVRTARSGERLAVIANLSSEPRTVDSSLLDEELRYDELALERLFKDEAIPMRPFQVRWLTAN